MATETKYALLSVFDKAGIEDFARGLVELGYSILASGGTAKTLTSANIPVKDVSELVGGDAILNHKVVTLSRELHAGLLADDSKEEIEELRVRKIPRIDLVCVDLYPLEEETKRPDTTLESVIKKTDIGGPTMIRSGAKGQRIVVCDPKDRGTVLEILKSGKDDLAWREGLAAKGEYTVARYVLISARYRSHGDYDGVLGKRARELCYGENKRQAAALFIEDEAANDPVSHEKFELIEGGDPSYINVTDHDRLLETATRTAAGFDVNTGNVPFMGFAVKHGNCSGAAVGSDKYEVIKNVVAGDYEAISGGFILTNFEIDEKCAELLRTHKAPGGKRILDGIIAPSLTKEAIDMLARKTGKCRVFVNPALAKLGRNTVNAARRFRQVRGGFLMQSGDAFVLTVPDEWKKKLSAEELDNLILGWGIGSTGNSNSIVLTKGRMLIGSGMGQRSRVMACKIALLYAQTYGHEVHGAFAYSDSFFPFPDGPETLAKAGVKKIFATSGSVNDEAVAKRAQELGVELFTLPDSEVRGFALH